jgi:hypothetical protein
VGIRQPGDGAGWGLLPGGAITGGFVADALGFRVPYLLGGIVIGIATFPSTKSMMINTGSPE